MSDPRSVSHTPPPPSHPAAPPYSSGPTPTPPSSNKNQLRNVIIGSIVTVCSSVLIYYLTVYMNKSKTDSGDNRLEMKEATISAWKSYMAYENTYTKNLMSFEKEVPATGLDPYIEGFKTESEKFKKDVADLAQTKNIDKDLVKALNRRLENETSSATKALAFYEKIKQINAQTTGDARKIKQEFVNDQLEWSLCYKGAFERAINDIQEIAKVLSEKYGQTFSMNDFLVVQMMPQRMKSNDSLIAVLQNIEVDSAGNIISNKNPTPGTNDGFAKNVKAADITGTWNASGDALSLLPNGKMIWVLVNGGKASGTWSLNDNKLRMDAIIASGNKKIVWVFNLSDITGNSFTMTLDASPYNKYHFVRIQVN